MKKESLIFVLAIFFCLICYSRADSQTITSEIITITGKLPTSPTNINFSILDTIYPAVFINNPENITYHNRNLLNLSLYAYDTSLIQAAWYNLDNGNNVSLSVSGTIVSYNTTFNRTEGNHTINFYANDSTGNKNLTTRYFSINNTKIIIIYYKFIENETTTNFNNLAEQQLENITFILANRFGVINITQAVNLTEYKNSSTNEIDLDTPINISYNRIFLNSSLLTDFFSVPSELVLNNLTFANPRILKDNQLCSSPQCVIISYNPSSGALIFSVTGFSVYSVEETSSEEPETPPSGGGGGAAPTIKRIQFNQTSTKIRLRQGESGKVFLKIKNIGQSSLEVKLNKSDNLGEFLKIREEKISLRAGEEKEVEIEVSVGEETIPDVYIGKIIAESTGTKEEVIFVVEVESRDKAFDVAVKIEEKYKEVAPGMNIFVNITIQNLEKFDLSNLQIDYNISDSEGKIIFSEQEKILLKRQISFIKEIKIPRKTKAGEYIFYIKVSYKGKAESTSDFFKVTKLEKPKLTKKSILIIITILIFLCLILIILRLRMLRRLSKRYKELVVRDNENK